MFAEPPISKGMLDRHSVKEGLRGDRAIKSSSEPFCPPIALQTPLSPEYPLQARGIHGVHVPRTGATREQRAVCDGQGLEVFEVEAPSEIDPIWHFDAQARHEMKRNEKTRTAATRNTILQKYPNTSMCRHGAHLRQAFWHYSTCRRARTLWYSQGTGTGTVRKMSKGSTGDYMLPRLKKKQGSRKAHALIGVYVGGHGISHRLGLPLRVMKLSKGLQTR